MKLLDDFFGIKEYKEGEKGFEYSIEFNPDHFIYAAHFPKNPITPGVCILQIAGELLERRSGYELELKTVNNIKYMAVISPLENRCVRYIFSSPVCEGEECRVKVTVENESRVFAKLSVTYRIWKKQ